MLAYELFKFSQIPNHFIALETHMNPLEKKTKRRRGARGGDALTNSPNTPAQTTAISSTTKSKKRKRGAEIPKIGDVDFLSPTQLRNKRKKNALKAKKLQAAMEDPTDSTSNSISNSNNKKKNNKSSFSSVDPSQRYIANPLLAPRVVAAQNFFSTNYPSLPPLSLFVDEKVGWRTHSKLAVRGTSPLKIGLFRPNSHDVIEGDSSAHHEKINQTVKTLSR